MNTMFTCPVCGNNLLEAVKENSKNIYINWVNSVVTAICSECQTTCKLWDQLPVRCQKSGLLCWTGVQYCKEMATKVLPIWDLRGIQFEYLCEEHYLEKTEKHSN